MSVKEYYGEVRLPPGVADPTEGNYPPSGYSFYVLASDYDRDTSALRTENDELRQKNDRFAQTIAELQRQLTQARGKALEEAAKFLELRVRIEGNKIYGTEAAIHLRSRALVSPPTEAKSTNAPSTDSPTEE